MKILQTIHHKKNELFEVESFKDKECTEAFDFKTNDNVYIELKGGDITPLHYIPYFKVLFCPYIPFAIYDKICEIDNILIRTLNDITPNLSKYIPEDNAVLFLSEEDKVKYTKSILTKTNSSYMVVTFDNYILCSYDKQFPKNHNKATIFLPHGTQSELQKASEVEKELRGKYRVEEVSLFALHWFIDDRYTSRFDTHRIGKRQTLESIFNKIITTNSTGISKPEDSTECLQVIDCKEVFEEYLKTQR